MKGTAKAATIEISGKRITTHRMSGKAPIDPGKFIPIAAPGTRTSAPIRAIRRADLLPKTAPAAAVAGYNNFGSLLVDVFRPTYGHHYPIGGRNAFIFSLARVSWIQHDMWKMQLHWDKIGYERFSFIVRQGKGNYLRVQLGQTQGAGVANGAIVGVKANSSQFLLDLSHRSFQFFDLVLLPTAHTVEFFLHSNDNPNRETILEIQQVELYDTIRVFPTEEVFA